MLDPGDFGPVTVTQSLTIAGDEANPSGVLSASGTSGIVISAGSGDAIILRGLVFDGANAGGTSGVVFSSGARLQIENCVFEGFTASGLTAVRRAPAAPVRSGYSFAIRRSSAT